MPRQRCSGLAWAKLGLQREKILLPHLEVWATFFAAVSRDQGSPKALLALCDKLRDVDIVELGVALDDQEGKADRSRRA